jgi:hypothetical protein
MITLMLWRRLRKPPANHPLFVRAIGMNDNPMPWYFALGAILLAPLVFPLGIMLLSDAYSLIWAVSASSAIAQERERGTLDLLYLLPFGAFGASWALYTGCIHRNQIFSRMSGIGVALFRIVFILIVLDALRGSESTFSSYRAQDTQQLFHILTLVAVVAVALGLDHVQSIVASSLVAMLVATFARTRFDAQLWAVIGLAGILLTTTLLAALTGLGIVPLVVRTLDIPIGDVVFSELVVSLAMFGILREGVIAVLWRAAFRRLNMDSADFDFAVAYRV